MILYKGKIKPHRKLLSVAKLIILALIMLGIVSCVKLQSVNPIVTTAFIPDEIPTDTYILPCKNKDNIIVWLDAGHGGFDPGTYVMLDGIRVYEKDIVLDIVLRTYELFMQSDSGVTVFLTRADDRHISLHDRIKLWNNTDYMTTKADLVVSVHADFYEGPTAQSVSGIQVNYCRNKVTNTGRIDITDSQFAQIMQNNLVSATGARDRLVRGDRGLFVPANSTMPAVLIEVGFMSNSNELAKLLTEEYRIKIAKAIYAGIIECL